MGKCAKLCSDCDNWTDHNLSTGYGTCKNPDASEYQTRTIVMHTCSLDQDRLPENKAFQKMLKRRKAAAEKTFEDAKIKVGAEIDRLRIDDVENISILAAFHVEELIAAATAYHTIGRMPEMREDSGFDVSICCPHMYPGTAGRPEEPDVKTTVIRRTEYVESRPMGQTAVGQNGAAVHAFCDEEYDLMKQADRLELLYRIAMGAAWEVNFDKECCEKFAFDTLEQDLKAAVQKAKKDLFL